MKVAELTGAHLDYWTGMALGKNVFIVEKPTSKSTMPDCRYESKYAGWQQWHPSGSWVFCGPLIEKFRMEVGVSRDSKIWSADANPWNKEKPGKRVTGSTPQIAICRAVVAFVYGNEVEERE